MRLGAPLVEPVGNLPSPPIVDWDENEKTITFGKFGRGFMKEYQCVHNSRTALVIGASHPAMN